jgi:tetratricopeptide (TPR) repeat protein
LFERYDNQARRWVSLCHEEARALDHDYIGTEHLLLALVRERDFTGVVILQDLGVSPDVVQHRAKELAGKGSGSPSGRIPFAPRAKKVLELALREALALGHDHVGTEHILLGLICEEEGATARVLASLGADLSRARRAVFDHYIRNGTARTAEARDLRAGSSVPPGPAAGMLDAGEGAISVPSSGAGVTVINHIRGSRRHGRLIAIFARISAGVLIGCSLIGSVSLLLAIPAVIPRSRRYIEWLPSVVVTHLWYSVLVALAALAAGAAARSLSRFGRQEVLFLRRFGDAETTAAVTEALNAVGSSWRVVALDDRMLKPVSAGRASRWTAWVEPLYLLSLSAAGSLLGVARKVGYVTLALLALMVWRARGTLQQRWGSVISSGGLLHVAARAGLEVIAFLTVAAVVFLILRWTMLPLFAMIFSLGTTKDADGSARGFIRGRADIYRTQKDLRRNAGRAVAARIAVVNVSDDLWRESVARLADDAAVVLVDVSRPTRHVIWEVEYLLAAGIPCVFVGAASRLSYLTDESSGAHLEAILRSRLDGRTVVAYVPGSQESPRPAFARALRASFERAGGRAGKLGPQRSDDAYRAQQHMAGSRPGKAIHALEQIAARRQQALGPDHTVTLCARRDLATACQAAGQHDEARALFEQILSAWERQPPGNGANAARLRAREDLAQAHEAAGRMIDVRRLRTQNVRDAWKSFDGRQQAQESGDRAALRAARDLAGAWHAVGRHDEAIVLLKTNLEACIRQGGISREDTAALEARDDLARAYLEIGQPAEALRIHRQNAKEAEQILGRDHPLNRELRRTGTRAWRANRSAAKTK